MRARRIQQHLIGGAGLTVAQLQLANQQLVEQRRVQLELTGRSTIERSCAATDPAHIANASPITAEAMAEREPRDRLDDMRAPSTGGNYHFPMPELPEVEVTRRSFASRVEGARVTGLRLGKPLRWPLGTDPESLLGQQIGPVTRRGKYLWLPLERGGLLMHLGMSGSLGLVAETLAPGPHDHSTCTPAPACCATDPRRFGAVVWSAAGRRPGRQAALWPRPRTLTRL